ncbi:tRNA cytosine(34) acetyltransferase TmcA [Pasteurellaceae bacterium Orientalotternb1]|nr:tRNA cytosine(34) acetyltransferase TmcA [Pasteurellaceae bacterium Orientalotternb1]
MRQGQIYLPSSLSPIPFSNAKTLLGQEFPYAIYDMRAENGVCLNLEALAIVAGTIQDNGTLFLLCPKWHELEQQVDFDSLRWNNQQAITTPNFYAYFKHLVAKLGFNVANKLPDLSENRDNATKKAMKLTAEQQVILQNLPLDRADIHLITAPRGRGKSTISGKLAEQLAKTDQVLITARSHSALPNFWKGIESTTIPFLAPDKLIQLVDLKKISPNQWLFIDEAASLPLPMLHTFCDYFAKVVLTTTTQNYEGTGRGFSLKFLPTLQRPNRQWQLSQPLRWQENDPLEAFINQLLLLDEISPSSPFSTGGTLDLERKISPFVKGELRGISKIDFYHLLAQAHYKTTPTDLRRLFDAKEQQLYELIENQQVIAGCWAMDEGGLDEALTQAIWQGERRPQGNLVAQYLCFQGNLPDACRLRSIRISRLAVQPEYQRQGYGKRLVSQIILQIDPLVEFVSVSFGLNNTLLQFWTECGFELVQITPNAEASSGLRSAMMLYPLTETGKRFVQQAKLQFERDLPLHPFFTEIYSDLQKIMTISPLVAVELNDQDRRNLVGFAHSQRSFASCYVSLKRLCKQYPEHFSELKYWFESAQNKLPQNQKMWITQLRNQIKDFQFL